LKDGHAGEQTRAILGVFVYGTLKRGERNHDRYCRGALDAAPATVRGWLYDLKEGHSGLSLGYGYPALVVPPETVLACGTGDYASDAAESLGTVREAGGHAPLVRGEVLAFDDPEDRLPALDALEGYVPGGESLYARVLIPATPTRTGEPLAAWTYVVADGSPGILLPGGTWPA